MGLRTIVCGAGRALLPLVMAAGLVADVAAQPPGGEAWIDVHVHLVGGRGPAQDYPGAVAAALAAMEPAGIKKMVLMPPPQVNGPAAPYDLDAFAWLAKRYAGRLAFLGGGGRLNPMLQEAALPVSPAVRGRFEKEARAILRQGAAGFGEISAHHLSLVPGHPYESVPADHPLLMLLADLAAEHDVVIDLHFDVVAEDMALPGWLTSPANPPRLASNLAAFERLLEHNPKARFVWAHAGSDFLGGWTVDLSRRLLDRHPNLYMSLRLAPARVPANYPVTPAQGIKPGWLQLLRDFRDRFVIGNDQFIAAPSLHGQGPGLAFARFAGANRARTRIFLGALPPDLRRQIGYDNAVRLYKLQD
ncbi:MAG: amidohydrolase family protein [Candidatus Rokubacteria bacterium]|nr:amidohydrolase family protein [Candidatus Rokubacteria bacterium]